MNASMPIVADYFGIFDQNWNDVLRQDTPLNMLNRMYISFGEIIQYSNGQFSVAIDGDPNRVTQLIGRVKQANPTAELFLTVGGDSSSTSYGGASKDPSFATNVMSIMNLFGFTGFDIDWEEGLVTSQLNSLTTNLYQAFRSNGYQLTLDVWPFSDPAYDFSVLGKTLNQMNIMSYGPGTPLNLSAQPFLDGGMTASQLIGGIEVESDYQLGPDTPGVGGSIADKASYAIENKFAGMMSWRLDNDYCIPDQEWPTYIGGANLWNDMTTFYNDPRSLRAALRAAKKNYDILLSKYDHDPSKIIISEKIMAARKTTRGFPRCN